jgi:hypothetical protein
LSDGVIKVTEQVNSIITETNEAVIIKDVSIEKIVVMSPTGIQGPPGQPGSSSINITAGMSIGGHRAISTLNGFAVYADKDTNRIIGISEHAANEGDVLMVVLTGEVSETSWNWTPESPLYLGTNGMITHDVPTSGYLTEIGIAITPTKILLDIKTPILLA